MMPTAFISHGSPARILGNSPAKKFTEKFPQFINKPKAILAISAHWLTKDITITKSGMHNTYYDFSGFPAELSKIVYRAEQPKWLTSLVESTLEKEDIKYDLSQRGLDHGVWTLLAVAYPKADIPVIAMSIPHYNNMEDYLTLGKKLSLLRKQGVLILGSGSVTHNLYDLDLSNGEPPTWATKFTLNLQKYIKEKNFNALINFYENIPHAKHAHPTPEHYLPILITLGAAHDENTSLIHDSYELGSLNNSSWLFGN